MNLIVLVRNVIVFVVVMLHSFVVSTYYPSLLVTLPLTSINASKYKTRHHYTYFSQ